MTEDRWDEVREMYAEDEPDHVLGRLVNWFGTYISVMNRLDLVLLALWVVHTHLAKELRTTPRLQLDSPLPESGKTTALEHLQRLCHRPILMSTVSSGALLPRLLEKGPRTILMRVPTVTATGQARCRGDHCHRHIGVSGRCVSAGAGAHQGWRLDEAEMSTFGPVVMAGISPRLDDDVVSRLIRVLLMPDAEVEDTDWDVIEDAAEKLKSAVQNFAESIRASVVADVDLPDGCRGRMKEKWRPLKRIAVAAEGDGRPMSTR